MIAPYMTLLAILVVAAAFTALIVILFRHATGATLPNAGWLDEFSIEKYRPLARLFDTADLEFVARQPGYTAALGRRLASSRRSAARQYLAELTLDFDRLLRLGREMIADSREDRGDLAASLVRYWLEFHIQVLSLRFRLRLMALGMRPARPAGLIEQLTRMRGVVAILEVPTQA